MHNVTEQIGVAPFIMLPTERGVTCRYTHSKWSISRIFMPAITKQYAKKNQKSWMSFAANCAAIASTPSACSRGLNRTEKRFAHPNHADGSFSIMSTPSASWRRSGGPLVSCVPSGLRRPYRIGFRLPIGASALMNIRNGSSCPSALAKWIDVLPHKKVNSKNVSMAQPNLARCLKI